MPNDPGGETPQIRKLLQSVDRWTHTGVARCLSDSVGIYCLLLETKQEYVYAIAKRYQYRDKASFPKRVVRRASDKEYPVAVFFSPQDVGNGYVFNPEQVLSQGADNRMDVPGKSHQIWVDMPVSKGVLYGDYISGREDIPKAQYHPPNQRFRVD